MPLPPAALGIMTWRGDAFSPPSGKNKAVGSRVLPPEAECVLWEPAGRELGPEGHLQLGRARHPPSPTEPEH